MHYNKIIVIGSGLAGCCLANLFANKNYLVEIYELKNHIGGNLYDRYNEFGILIHQYGPHIFHTNNQEVWDFINQFSEFINYTNQVLVKIDDQLVQLPINLNSIKQLFPSDYNNFINEIKTKHLMNKSVAILDLKATLTDANNLKIVDYIYDHVYKNYTAKMWGIKANEINPDILKRVKINLDQQWNYFVNDKYQAIPKDGYTKWLTNMINHKNIKLFLNTNGLEKIKLLENKISFDNQNDCLIIYTGKLDQLFNYCYGKLAYRSLDIQFETYNIDSYQPTAVVNYPNDKTITRITEYKKLTLQHKDNITTISKEIPGSYDENSKIFNTPFYPINNQVNTDLKNKYLELSKQYQNLLLVGRLSEYKYYDMDDIIERCLNIFKEQFN